MRIGQKPTFRRAYKKLHSNQRADVDAAIRAIVDTPDLGVEKKGDLHGMFVHKFNCVNQEYLLAYEWGDEWCILLGLGLGRLNPQQSHDRKMNLVRVEQGAHRHPTHVAHTSILNQYQKSKCLHSNRNHYTNQLHENKNEVHLLIWYLILDACKRDRIHSQSDRKSRSAQFSVITVLSISYVRF